MDKPSIVTKYRPALEPFEQAYRQFHKDPELSKQEAKTAAQVSAHLKALGRFAVHEGIGGHGVVGVLRNGPGPTILLRADMDALPHKEMTGLDYASTKVAVDPQGKETPVMHACGHDMHTAVLMAVSTLLHAAQDNWSGTLICLFQPAEETASGARGMVADGLYDEQRHGIPKPDVVLGQHLHAIKAGVVAISGGPILTAVDSFEVRVFGKSGHISRPDLSVDPVTTASHIIVRLQTLVTKEVRPEDFAVIACASIHGGSTANIIPEHVDLKLSIRSYRPEVHARLVAAVKRVIHAECDMSGSSKIHAPIITTVMHAPPTINDVPSAETLKASFRTHFGDNVIESDPFGASEDFSYLASACGAPYVFYMFGGVEPATWDRAVREGTVNEIPHNHSAFFAPVIEPTLKTGVDAFSLAALTFLGGPP